MSNRNLAHEFSSKFGGNHQKPRTRKRQATLASTRKSGPSVMRRGLILGGAATTVAFVGFNLMVNSSKPSTEEPIPRKLRIVLIDSSDRNTAVQDRLITRTVETEAVADIREGDRLILLGLTADQNEPLEERFNRVSPARAADKSAWQADPETLERKWKSEFLGEYVTEARNLRDIVEKKQTPFLEAMNQIASILNAYDAEEKDVIIVSDALQHIRQGLSAYTDAKSRSVIEMPEALTSFYQPDFGSAKVTLLHIMRAQNRKRQGKKHRLWIDQIITEKNADLIYVPLS